MAVRPNVNGSNAVLDDGLDHFNGGSLQIRTGTQPGTGGATATGDLLATITLPTPAFGAASSRGRGPASNWSASVSASGTAGWARMEASSGGAVVDLAVGEGSGDLSLDDVALVEGGTVTVTGGAISLPANDA
jgi:hypothetical protein